MFIFQATVEWCKEAEACYTTCETAVVGTYDACTTEWEEVFGCLGETKEEVEESTNEEYECPGLCEDSANGFMTALN